MKKEITIDGRVIIFQYPLKYWRLYREIYKAFLPYLKKWLAPKHFPTLIIKIMAPKDLPKDVYNFGALGARKSDPVPTVYINANVSTVDWDVNVALDEALEHELTHLRSKYEVGLEIIPGSIPKKPKITDEIVDLSVPKHMKVYWYTLRDILLAFYNNLASEGIARYRERVLHRPPIFTEDLAIKQFENLKKTLKEDFDKYGQMLDDAPRIFMRKGEKWHRTFVELKDAINSYGELAYDVGAYMIYIIRYADLIPIEQLITRQHPLEFINLYEKACKIKNFPKLVSIEDKNAVFCYKEFEKKLMDVTEIIKMIEHGMTTGAITPGEMAWAS